MTEIYEDGAVLLTNGMTLSYVWSSLHINARMELKLENDPRFQYEVNRFSQELKRLLDSLSEVEAERWLALCHAAGMTVFGVVGLSWCKNATSEMVWAAWNETQYDLTPEPVFKRPIKLINSKLMPKTSVLTEIVAACGNNGRCATLAVAGLADASLTITLDAS